MVIVAGRVKSCAVEVVGESKHLIRGGRRAGGGRSEDCPDSFGIVAESAKVINSLAVVRYVSRFSVRKSLANLEAR